MSSDFYTEMKGVADELLTEFGKSIVLSRASRSDGNDPWEQDQGPAATSAAQSISGLFGVQIDLDREALELSTTERRLGRWVVQASDAIPEEVGIEWILTADGLSFEIFSVTPVRPGPLLLVYFILVAL